MKPAEYTLHDVDDVETGPDIEPERGGAFAMIFKGICIAAVFCGGYFIGRQAEKDAQRDREIVQPAYYCPPQRTHELVPIPNTAPQPTPRRHI